MARCERRNGWQPERDDPAPPDSYAYRRGEALLARLRATPKRCRKERWQLHGMLTEMIRLQIREDAALESGESRE